MFGFWIGIKYLTTCLGSYPINKTLDKKGEVLHAWFVLIYLSPDPWRLGQIKQEEQSQQTHDALCRLIWKKRADLQTQDDYILSALKYCNTIASLSTTDQKHSDDQLPDWFDYFTWTPPNWRPLFTPCVQPCMNKMDGCGFICKAMRTGGEKFLRRREQSSLRASNRQQLSAFWARFF